MMKISSQILIDHTPVAEISKRLRLELNGAGRGIVCLKSETEPRPGQSFLLNMQLADNPPQQVFQGFIEAVTPLAKSAYKITVREFAAMLNQPVTLNCRHCRAADVLAQISDKTGLVFILPERPWAQADIARFQHIGGGYGALDQLLRVFQVSQGVWAQQPDGRIYLGELEYSISGGKAMAIQPELMTDTSHHGGTIPALPRLRPGVKIRLAGQQHIITSIDIIDQNMRLNWTDRLSDKRLQGVA